MKAVGGFIAGFVLALLCLSMFTPAGGTAVLFVYSALLYLLFFHRKGVGIPPLIGFTIGLELLSTHRFGTGFVASSVIYGMYVVFNLRLRFTSQYIRFIVALLIGLAAAAAILYPPDGYAHRLLGIALVSLIISSIGALIQRLTNKPSHELL
ncbi:MAG TPA: hypothetical protein VLA04_05615 [Verrucomicrobiae bacterium]|nr:hypothetical protein [Verrucomicrobiae bacterium]